jgi:hypothetical protein
VNIPTYTQAAKVTGHKTEATILNADPRFLKNPTERIMVETIELNPKPPKQPKSKNDCNLLSLMSGSILPTKP